MSTELRPTPRTDQECFVNEGDFTTGDFARGLERECDEARDKLAALERSIADLSHPNIKDVLSQRDQLLTALEKVEFYGATGCLQDSLDEAKRIARAAIAAVKGGDK